MAKKKKKVEPLSPEALATYEDSLVQAALAVQKRAYAPYSKFHVGAALLCDDQSIVSGCNVENASYGLALCAERSATAVAVAAGHLHYSAVAIATSTSPPSPPCGVCLQTLAEFERDMMVILVNPQGERVKMRLATLLPVRFNKESLL